MLNSKDGSGRPSWSSASLHGGNWAARGLYAKQQGRIWAAELVFCKLATPGPSCASSTCPSHAPAPRSVRAVGSRALVRRPALGPAVDGASWGAASCTCSSFSQRQIVPAREPKGQTPNSRIPELAAGNDTAQADAGTPLRRGAVEGQGEEPVLGPAAPGATTVRGRRKTLHEPRVAIVRVRRDPPRAVAAVWCFVPGPSPEPLAEPLFAG